MNISTALTINLRNFSFFDDMRHYVRHTTIAFKTLNAFKTLKISKKPANKCIKKHILLDFKSLNKNLSVNVN